MCRLNAEGTAENINNMWLLCRRRGYNAAFLPASQDAAILGVSAWMMVIRSYLSCTVDIWIHYRCCAGFAVGGKGGFWRTGVACENLSPRFSLSLSLCLRQKRAFFFQKAKNIFSTPVPQHHHHPIHPPPLKPDRHMKEAAFVHQRALPECASGVRYPQ